MFVVLTSAALDESQDPENEEVYKDRVGLHFHSGFTFTPYLQQQLAHGWDSCLLDGTQYSQSPQGRSSRSEHIMEMEVG